MTYEEAKQTLEKYASLGSVYGLDGITRLMEALGRPERQLKVIHVAGTNGKGSTVTTLAAILEACGYHTATYTSPEVSTYLDRFRIGGVPADEAVFTTAFEKWKQLVYPSFLPGILIPPFLKWSWPSPT